MTSEKELEKIRQLLQEVSVDDCNIFDDSSNSESDICEPVYRNSDTEPSDISDTEKLTSSDDKDDENFMIGKDKKTKWRKSVITKNVRTRVQNIVIHLPGPKFIAKQMKSPLDCFNLLAVIGLLIIAGSFRSSKENLVDLWAVDGTGIDIFHATMSMDRFLFLMRCLRFDDINDCAQRKELDKLAPVRKLFTIFVQNCQNAYTISEYSTIDQQLVAFRGKCPFRQYIPSKPAKYGIKIQTLCDARTWYVLSMEIYAGKQPAGPYELSNAAKDVVHRLTEPIENTGRNITLDNWFTSIPLAEELLQKKLTLVGTLRKNKPQLPRELIDIKKRILYSTIFAYNNQITALSYVPKKGKNVVLISTMHSNSNDIDSTTGDAKKPEIISFYNTTKILDIAGINSQVIFVSNNPETKTVRRLFLRGLGLDLLKLQVSKRVTTKTVPRSLRLEAAKYANLPVEKLKQSSSQNRSSGRCIVCPSNKDKKLNVRAISVIILCAKTT
ncbi:uncharacterized protein LOC112592035 [Melanaphis sacchari]|uniref:uncharacterized protein LOC112592035 n=1 Tax=Melanaphis sacchari TaxID=742174 RepID=UPI000DC14E94|nr:uncharacterized protein LOC112592035 [Melanaphis sacchari]